MSAKGGPIPDTPAVQRAKGAWGADQRERAMPKPKLGEPKMPTAISKPAQAIWKRIIPLLQEQNTLAKIDGDQLARYCDMLAKYWRCSEVLEKQGDTYETQTQSGDTMIRPRPEAAMMLQLDTALRRTEARFGMTPGDRLSIGVAIGEIHKAERRAKRDDDDPYAIIEVGI